MTGGDAFVGKTVLVTGATGGFGMGLAQRFAALGARLVLGDLDRAKLETLARSLDAECAVVEGDIAHDDTSAALVRLAVARFGRLDLAINNAGVASGFRRIEETAPEEAQTIVAVNLLGVFHAMRNQIPQMRKQHEADGSRSAIVNMASIAGVIGASRLAVYSAAKHGVVGLTRSAALENARGGIRINAVCPTFTPTAMLTDTIVNNADETDLARLASGIPMRRLAKVDEVVEAVVYAASPAAGFLTGQTINVDGGITAG